MYHRFCRKSRKKIKELNAKKTKNLTELRLIFPGSFYIKEHSRTSMTLEHIFQKASNIIDIIEKKNKNKNKKKTFSVVRVLGRIPDDLILLQSLLVLGGQIFENLPILFWLIVLFIIIFFKANKLIIFIETNK